MKSTTHPDVSKGKRTKHVPQAETDANLIIARYQQTGKIAMSTDKPLYADVSKTKDFAQAVRETIKLGIEKGIAARTNKKPAEKPAEKTAVPAEKTVTPEEKK